MAVFGHQQFGTYTHSFNQPFWPVVPMSGVSNSELTAWQNSPSLSFEWYANMASCSHFLELKLLVIPNTLCCLLFSSSNWSLGLPPWEQDNCRPPSAPCSSPLMIRKVWGFHPGLSLVDWQFGQALEQPYTLAVDKFDGHAPSPTYRWMKYADSPW